MKKREFIKTSAVLASTALLPSSIFAITKSQQRLRTAHIGVGGMGAADLESIASHALVDVVALCDIDQKNLEAAHKLYPSAKTYTDYRILLQEMQSENFFQILKNKIDQDLKFLQIREKALSERDLITFIKQIKRLLKRTNVKIIINGSIDLAYKYELDGVHLNSIQLYELENFPNDLLVGVSCHSKKDLEVAEEKNADYVVLGPVKKTLSHPNGDFMGWNKFKNLAEKSNLPVYAIGGMKKNDIALSFENGAIGIASQRDFWNF